MKKGFTLIELIIVVLIISILATLAIPQYIKAVERAKGGEARFHLRQIAGALGQYRAYYNHYIDITSANNNGEFGPALEEFMEINLTGDKDWNYTVDAIGTAGAEDQFDANATRIAGPYTGKQISVDENTTWTGDWPLK